MPKLQNHSSFSFRSHGVNVSIASNDPLDLEEFRRLLPSSFPVPPEHIEPDQAEHIFVLKRNHAGKDQLFKNGELIVTQVFDEEFLPILTSHVRLAVAEFAPELVFVHAGVVGLNGRAIVIPGESHSGKSTLTAELVMRGAKYYSDEYALFNAAGLVEPFAKPLSIRGEIDERTQIDHPVERFGGTSGTSPIPVKMVFVTKYVPNSRWRPKLISPAAGTIELIKNTIPIRRNPQFALSVLAKIAEKAIFVKTHRQDVSKSADLILELFRVHCDSERP